MTDKKDKHDKNFTKPPDWKKVEEAVRDTLKHFDTMTYTEKNNVMMVLKSTVDREFSIITLIDWLTHMKESEENINLEKLGGMSQYG